MLREGSQILLPEQVAEGLRNSFPVGNAITVWGIRARRAPVITMLAWSSREGEATPNFVERPAWNISSLEVGTQLIEVAGEVIAPLYTPQGEIMGVILQDGMVARFSVATASLLGERLNVGRRLAAAGYGTSNNLGRSLDAQSFGESLGNLKPLSVFEGKGR